MKDRLICFVKNFGKFRCKYCVYCSECKVRKKLFVDALKKVYNMESSKDKSVL